MTSTVIIADDHPVVVAGVETILKAHRYEVVARAHDTDTLFDALAEHPCDVVVTDYSMPEGSQPDGMPMIRRIRAARPDTGIVVLTMMSNPAILRSLLDMGVAAIFDKRTNLRDIPVAVHAADVGRSYLSPAIRRLFHEADCANGHDDATRLSPREVEVLRAFAQGHGLGDIAILMGRSFKTISRQKRSAMNKLGLANDAQLYQYLAGVRAGMLDDWSPAVEAAATLRFFGP
ncbi:two-component system capsular synthesis response regulator RcsB [Luteibacter jiangsuensis]|uniref:Two-component system capsular synthesis response regulator RcsB n=1 Tax=Luteibacter jiangsuensis TaxID=637577 RepID=A0ABT9SZC3_9GAMM|nr:response regulator [Luteibacter jiangsuensis]MDQ0010349.1 two-component system capsular synthesis response regulator RcsB [Luteibacter jiangsuensis]